MLLAGAALDRDSGQFQLGHHAGREVDARLTQLGKAHRGAGGATQCAEHQLLLTIASVEGRRNPTSWPERLTG
jgi:hypothetical protein